MVSRGYGASREVAGSCWCGIRSVHTINTPRFKEAISIDFPFWYQNLYSRQILRISIMVFLRPVNIIPLATSIVTSRDIKTLTVFTQTFLIHVKIRGMYKWCTSDPALRYGNLNYSGCSNNASRGLHEGRAGNQGRKTCTHKFEKKLLL